jgi:DnaK suppressor protein
MRGLTQRKVKQKVAQKRKKTTKKTSKPVSTEQPLTVADMEHFQQLLLKKRHEIMGNVLEMEDEVLRKSRQDSSGDLSSVPIHMADLGTDNYEQEFALGLMDSERKLLYEINDALQRIKDGTYGICEGTQKPIKKARLEAQPWAKYCIEYASIQEKKPVREEEEQ